MLPKQWMACNECAHRIDPVMWVCEDLPTNSSTVLLWRPSRYHPCHCQVYNVHVYMLKAPIHSVWLSSQPELDPKFNFDVHVSLRQSRILTFLIFLFVQFALLIICKTFLSIVYFMFCVFIYHLFFYTFEEKVNNLGEEHCWNNLALYALYLFHKICDSQQLRAVLWKCFIWTRRYLLDLNIWFGSPIDPRGIRVR